MLAALLLALAVDSEPPPDPLMACIAAAQAPARECARPCRRKRPVFRRDACEAPCKFAYARAVLACFEAAG